ncbi:MAG: recombination-associated protein RdgC [Neisseriaceae bacterium]|nr:recombination-associated protein RdgC [Neisseriaceae bacterium]MBR3425297.1 recombination-associated protein RdgC [Neisseriaceae bacterium]
MWIKQAKFFMLPENAMPDSETLSQALSEHAFQSVSSLALFSEGFANAVPFADDLVFSTQNSDKLSLKKEERILPSAAVNDLLAERINDIQAKTARTVGRKEKQRIKEELVNELLPKTLTKSSRTHLFFVPKHGLLLVDTANANKAENAISRLREALGDLPAVLPNTVKSPAALMTDWLLSGECAGSFDLDDSCEMKSLADETGTTVRIAKADLTSDEVVQHAKGGKTVTQLGLTWQEKIAFVLGDDLSLKRIRFLDIVQEEAENDSDDLPALTAATQLLATQTLADMFDELIAHLGGVIE